jgi:hypothetical protein
VTTRATRDRWERGERNKRHATTRRLQRHRGAGWIRRRRPWALAAGQHDKQLTPTPGPNRTWIQLLPSPPLIGQMQALGMGGAPLGPFRGPPAGEQRQGVPISAWCACGPASSLPAALDRATAARQAAVLLSYPPRELQTMLPGCDRSPSRSLARGAQQQPSPPHSARGHSTAYTHRHFPLPSLVHDCSADPLALAQAPNPHMCHSTCLLCILAVGALASVIIIPLRVFQSICCFLFLSEVRSATPPRSRWGPRRAALFAIWGDRPCVLVLEEEGQIFWRLAGGPPGATTPGHLPSPWGPPAVRALLLSAPGSRRPPVARLVDQRARWQAR